MHLERKKDISVFYWLQDLFSAYPHINVVDGFPLENLELPSVSIDWTIMTNDTYELGNRSGDFDRAWYIDVFTVNKSQRDDFTYLILEALENPIPVYDYDEGFPPSVSPTQLGYLRPENTEIRRIPILPELVEKLYYRSEVRFSTKYSEI
jgi:hypothetical protein